MLKLTVLLCTAMFAVLVIAGEDRGQMRPGLSNAPVRAITPAPQTTPQAVLSSAPVTEPVASAVAAPADVASISAPVSISPDPALAEDETPFSLAAYSDPAAPADSLQPTGSLAYVDAAAVNVRDGPGTGNPVLTRLTRGEAVTIVSTDESGWARIRLEGDGLEGFMSMKFLAAAP